jgi:adenine-specific DNA methylase
MFDLIGYTKESDLTDIKILEPSCGEGAFLVGILERLLVRAKGSKLDYESLKDLVRAFDINESYIYKCRKEVIKSLIAYGLSSRDSELLAETWVRVGDFLLERHDHKFDLVIGNPPYIRIEELDRDLQNKYRNLYSTLYDRADIYVAFIEKSLQLLSNKGKLCFICTDRWTVNKYGTLLRSLITKNYKVINYLDLKETSPFESKVSTYPVIFTIGQGKTTTVPVTKMRTLSQEECEEVVKNLTQENEGIEWFNDGEPWLIDGTAHINILRYLEQKFETIEESASVGIGIATGCDDVYIIDKSELPSIETTRIVPLVMRDNISAGNIHGPEKYIINTFENDGSVIDIKKYPLLEKYFHQNEERIKNRHVAKKNPKYWYRTIDRLHVDLVNKPKLLIPDIAGWNDVTLDSGKFYPHHNLYYIVSEAWDIRVLGGLLSSKIAMFFIWVYSMKMRGGYLRFQAQYLRKIRIPSPSDIKQDLAESIRDAYIKRDFKRLDKLALEVYGIKEMPHFEFNDGRA